MKRLLLLLIPILAMAQSVPNGGSVIQGQVWTAARWRAAWQAKTDYPLYAATAAEVAGGVSIINPQVAPCNINRYGANTTPGTSDMTVAVQASSNVCNVVYVPSGRYLVGAITMPLTGVGVGQVIYGDGISSVLVQKSTGSLLSWSSPSLCCYVLNGYVRNLAFVATAGTTSTIYVAGVSGMTLENLYFTDTPRRSDDIFINGSNGTYNHDTRLTNIQVYSSSGINGNAGIQMGSLVSDCRVDRFIMNGNFTVSYAIQASSGALTCTVADSHPYNSKINNVIMEGGNNDWYFVGNTFDYASTSYNVAISASSRITFTSNWFETVGTNLGELQLNSTSQVYLTNNKFGLGQATTGYAVQETGTSDYTQVAGGDVFALANWNNGPFSLSGEHSGYWNVNPFTNARQQKIASATLRYTTGTMCVLAAGYGTTGCTYNATGNYTTTISPAYTNSVVCTATPAGTIGSAMTAVVNTSLSSVTVALANSGGTATNSAANIVCAGN
jgi:hypothetical protein